MWCRVLVSSLYLNGLVGMCLEGLILIGPIGQEDRGQAVVAMGRQKYTYIYVYNISHVLYSYEYDLY